MCERCKRQMAEMTARPIPEGYPFTKEQIIEIEKGLEDPDGGVIRAIQRAVRALPPEKQAAYDSWTKKVDVELAGAIARLHPDIVTAMLVTQLALRALANVFRPNASGLVATVMQCLDAATDGAISVKGICVGGEREMEGIDPDEFILPAKPELIH